MKILVSKKQFAAALKAVMPAVATRATLPALSGVHIEVTEKALAVGATDLEVAAQRHLEDGVSVGKPGAIVAPAKALAKAMASMPIDEVAIETIEHEGGSRIVLRSGSRTVTLDAHPSEDFPVVPEARRLKALGSLRGSTLADAFARAVLCASRDEARPALAAVALFFEEGSSTLQVVATDSYRMGIIRVELAASATETRTLLVPARICKELAKQVRPIRDTVVIGLVDRGEETPRAVAVTFGASFWSARLIEGEFPNWRQIVPEETGAAIEFKVAEMTSALEAAEAVGNGGGAPVRLRLGKPSSIELVDQGTTVLRETLSSAVFSPDGVGEIEVAFNPGYLADALRFVGDDRTRMWVRDSLKPALMGSADRRYVLMPVRLS